MKWKIGNVEIDNSIVVAPMAGISNEAFRTICKKFHAGLIYTEMISDKALFYDNKKTIAMMNVHPEEHPLSMQLFGHDVETMVLAAKRMDEGDCDIIDINMGCPVTKVIKAHAGSALLLEEDYACELVKTIVASVHKPVTVKLRLGFDKDHINVLSMARKLEKAGASALCIHGRTRAQMYEGQANWELIKQVKQQANIPIIGNGDIRSCVDFKNRMEETHVDAIMIGRALHGNPWLIQEIYEYLETGEVQTSPTVQDRFALMKEHAQSLIALKGEVIGIREMRGHAVWYVKGLPASHKVKEKLANMETYEEMVQIIEDYQKQIEDAAS